MNAKKFLSLLDAHLPLNTAQITVFSYEQSIISLEDAYQLISSDEQYRANQFVFPEHKHRFIIAHAMLRLVLAHFVSCQPHDLVFSKRSAGKPYLADSDLVRWEFNLSHCDTGFGIVVSQHIPVGIDIECLQPGRAPLELAQRFFSLQEARAIEKRPISDQSLAFYRLWTCKEAILKATGDGIVDGLSRWIFDIDAEQPELVAAPESINRAAWDFYHQLLPNIDAVLTVAASVSSIQFRYSEINPG